LVAAYGSPMTDIFTSGTYRSAKTLALVVVVLFAVQLGCYALYVVLAGVQIAVPNIQAGDSGLTIPFLLIGMIAVVEGLARLATVVMFLVWLFRIYTNFPALGVRNLDFSPGWAVGWWFIPFANLLKPYQVVTEAWRESDPEFDPEFGYLSSSGGSSWQFTAWWGTFILGNITSRVGDAVIGDPATVSLYPYVLVLTVLFLSVSAMLAIWIVRNTTSRQDVRATRIRQTAKNDQPPPPPIFDKDL